MWPEARSWRATAPPRKPVAAVMKNVWEFGGMIAVVSGVKKRFE